MSDYGIVPIVILFVIVDRFALDSLAIIQNISRYSGHHKQNSNIDNVTY